MKSSSLTCLENSKNKIGVDVKITLLLFFIYIGKGQLVICSNVSRLNHKVDKRNC